jgi:hypothetical protein
MAIEQEAFRKYNIEKKVDSFTVRLNENERAEFEAAKNIIEQPKDSTAIKQLAWIGINVLHDKKVSYIVGSLFKNKKNNARLGIADFD